MYINIFMCTYIQIHARSKLHTKFAGFAFMCSMFSIAFTFSKRCVYASRACTISNTQNPKHTESDRVATTQSANGSKRETMQTYNLKCAKEKHTYTYTQMHTNTHTCAARAICTKKLCIHKWWFIWKSVARSTESRKRAKGKNIRKRRLKIQKLN